jgi:hypothetical protein
MMTRQASWFTKKQADDSKRRRTHTQGRLQNLNALLNPIKILDKTGYMSNKGV